MGTPPLAARAEQAATARAQIRDRVVAIAGLLVIALLVLDAFVKPGLPGADAGADAVAAQLIGDRAAHQSSILANLLSDVAFLVFLAGVWTRLRRAEERGGLFTSLFAISAAVFVSAVLVSEGLLLGLVKAASTDRAALPALLQLNIWVGIAAVPAAVTMFLGAAGAIHITRALPGWLGWVAAVTAALWVVGLATVVEGNDGGIAAVAAFGGFLLTLVWILCTSVVLLLRAGQQAEVTTGTQHATAG